ncbi:MAG: hypothetical protein WBH50_01250, partial [Fuerstiella sp.]
CCPQRRAFAQSMAGSLVVSTSRLFSRRLKVIFSSRNLSFRGNEYNAPESIRGDSAPSSFGPNRR